MTELMSTRPSVDTQNSPQKTKRRSKKSKSKKNMDSVNEKEKITQIDDANGADTSSYKPNEPSNIILEDATHKVSRRQPKKSLNARDQTTKDNAAELLIKSKKRKHMTDNDIQIPGPSKSKDDKILLPGEPSRKKHKNRTEFADPRVDSTLNAQSRKGLEYAFLQMNRPSKWKFNKARQNWLIRNIWNPEAISDAYFPFVLKYFAKVQGGSREKLKEICQTYLQLAEPTETEKKADDTPSPAPKSILKNITSASTSTPTAGPAVDTAPTPGPLIASASIALPDKSIPSAHVLDHIRRQRAQSLLDALRSTTATGLETSYL